MSNYEIITINDNGSSTNVVRFHDFGVDLREENYDKFDQFKPTAIGEWLEKTKDFVCIDSLVPYTYGWNRNHPLFEKLKYDPYEARIFQTSKYWDFKICEKIYLFKEVIIIQSIENLNKTLNTDYDVVIRPDLVAKTLEGLVEVQEKLDALTNSDTAGSLIHSDNTESICDSRISDFIKLNTLMGNLYEKDSYKLRKHLKKAYLEINMIDTIKNKFNKNDDEAEKTLYALNRVYWLVENKSFSFEKAKIKVSIDLGVSLDELSSLSASRSSFKKYMKKI